MTFDLLVVLAVLVGAVILFATGRLPVDLVALAVLAILVLTGIVSPQEGFQGFSNPATVTVAAMFVLSAGVYQTGILNALGLRLPRLGRRSLWLALIVMMAGVGAVSAFINNTAAVAIFMPIVIAASRDSGRSASQFLMPLSFAGMFGGVCTLIGTSTNILVNEIAVEHGIAAFGMFEFARLGLVFFAVGLLYMLVGVRLIPERRETEELTERFRLNDYLAEVVLLEDSVSVGKPLAEAPLLQDVDIDLLEIHRGGLLLVAPLPPDVILQAGDLLRVRGDVAKLEKLQRRKGVRLKPKARWRDEDLQSDQAVLVEAVVAPNSELEGRSLKAADFASRFGATALALRTRDGLLHERIGRAALRAGDALLCEVRRESLPRFRREEAFVVVSDITSPRFRARKALPALAILVAVVAGTFGILPIAATATAGAVAMVLLRCLTLEEAYQAIPAKVIVLLAGVLTLGVGIDRTGGSTLLASFLVQAVGDWGPVALVAAFYLVTALLTALMSNNATAALLAPIAIAGAKEMGVDPRPMLMAVTFAASANFMTPRPSSSWWRPS